MTVAALPRRNGMGVGERESHQVVIELCVEPVVGRVAVVASHREICGNVVRRRGLHEIGLMAGVALGRHRGESALSPAFVAGIAVDRGMGAGQREPIIVLLDLLD